MIRSERRIGDKKALLKAKRLLAGWDGAYLLKVLSV
jgi:hypothetical protein